MSENEAQADGDLPLTASPSQSATSMRLRSEPPRVTRISRRMMLAGVALIASVGLGGALIYALQTRDAARGGEELYRRKAGRRPMGSPGCRATTLALSSVRRCRATLGARFSMRKTAASPSLHRPLRRRRLIRRNNAGGRRRKQRASRACSSRQRQGWRLRCRPPLKIFTDRLQLQTPSLG